MWVGHAGNNVSAPVDILHFPSALWTPSAHSNLVCFSQTHQAEPTLSLAPAQASWQLLSTSLPLLASWRDGQHLSG